MERLKITIGPRYYQHAHEIVSGAQARIKAAQRDRDRMTQSRDTWRDRALEAEAKLKAITQAIGWHQAMNTTPQGAQSAQALQSFPYEARELRDFADNGTAGRLRVMLDSIALWHESALRTALAAPPPEPEKFNLHDVVPPSAPEWVEGNRAAVSPDWMSGWDACRNRTRLLVIGLVAAMRQGLAAPEGPAPTDPDMPQTEREAARYIDGWNDCVVAGEFQTVRQMTRDDYDFPKPESGPHCGARSEPSSRVDSSKRNCAAWSPTNRASAIPPLPCNDKEANDV